MDKNEQLLMSSKAVLKNGLKEFANMWGTGILCILFCVLIIPNIETFADAGEEKMILVLAFLAFLLVDTIYSALKYACIKQGSIKIYENYVECVSYLGVLSALQGEASSTMMIRYEDIQSIGHGSGFLMIDGNGKRYRIYCLDITEAERIIKERVEASKK